MNFTRSFFVFFAHFGNFSLVSIGACDKFSFPSVVVSLSMSQTRGSCGHIKGNYDNHSSCLNCTGCFRSCCCSVCLLGPTRLGHWCLSVGASLTDGRWAGRRKKRRKQRRRRVPPLGILLVQDPILNRLLRGRTHPGLPPTVAMMTTHQFCLCHHLGVSGYAGTLGSLAVEAHTEHRVQVRGDSGPTIPPQPDPRAKDFEATLLDLNPTPGVSNQVTLSKDRSPRSESKCPVERSNSGDTGQNTRLALKGSVQQTSVIQPEVSEHGPVFPGPGAGLMTGTRYRDPVPGIQDTVRPAPPGKPGTMTTPDAPDLLTGDSVTPGDSVRPVSNGQEDQKEKNDKALDRSELPVLNSPGNSVQLEHNDHMQQRTMPNLLAEHVSEYTEVGQDFMNSDSSNVKANESSNRTQLPHSEHMPPGIGHTGNPLRIGHTGNRSDQEQGSVRIRHHSDVSPSSRRDSNTRRNTIPLQHADPGEHSPASMIRHRPARSRSRSYESFNLSVKR